MVFGCSQTLPYELSPKVFMLCNDIPGQGLKLHVRVLAFVP